MDTDLKPTLSPPPNDLGSRSTVRCFQPGSFEPSRHYYPKVLNAQIHPLVRFLLNLEPDRIVSRYCHLNPQVDRMALGNILSYQTKYFCWAGADLFHVTTPDGLRRMVVIETNSCPSGQKSMPLSDDLHEMGGYERLIRHAFLPRLQQVRSKGVLAVLYDKNEMESSGYAASLSQLTKEAVYLVPFYEASRDQIFRYRRQKLEVKIDEKWEPVRAAIRYVTQKPWNRLPIACRTEFFNPVVACLAGGRNKLVASKAYELFNAELAGSGLAIHTPHTVHDVSLMEIPFVVRSLGGRAVVKIPYSNAGQGVYTITNETELNNFMKHSFGYGQFIVQSLIGNSSWSSQGPEGEFFHVGTVPNKSNQIYVADLRFMVGSGPQGFRPICLYARQAARPLEETLTDQDSWSMLGTNLSIKLGDNQWSSDTDRLILMDRKDFNLLGLGLDDLIASYIQTVLATTAIDKMIEPLLSAEKKLNVELFQSLNKDDELIEEIFGDEA